MADNSQANMASNNSANKSSPTANVRPSRLPAPTLFVGPPSRNNSQRTIPRVADQPSSSSSSKPSLRPLPRSGLTRTTTSGSGDLAINAANNNTDNIPPGAQQSSATNPDNNNTDSSNNNSKNDHRPNLPTATKPSDRSIDAKYHSMQASLNEVELTAQSTTHVFGAAHAAALDSLRNAQVALARAWGRGNEDQAAAAAEGEKLPTNSLLGSIGVGGGGKPSDVQTDRFKDAEKLARDRAGLSSGGRPRTATAESASTNLSDESAFSDALSGSPPGRDGGTKTAATATAGADGGDSASYRTRGSTLVDEAATDIRRASERRAANEAYFRQVDRGVKEVVEKLERVAEAMRGVEAESRSLWSERSSEDAESRRGDGAGGDDGSGGAGGGGAGKAQGVVTV